MAEKLITPKKDTEEILEFLSESSIFKDLPGKSLEKISKIVQIDSFAKDHIVIKKGSPGVRLYLIKSGSARVVSESEEEEFTIATIPDGKCFGEMSLLTGEPCNATVKTNEDSTFYFITKSDFDDIISENPLIYKHFNKLLAERVDKQNIKSIDLKKHEIALSSYLQKTKEYQYSSVVWKCKKMREIVQEAERLSKTDVPITIISEHGAGKETMSRKIHSESARAKSPVIEIILAKERRKEESPVHNERRKRDQIECELFGSEKIEFTEGEARRTGRLELVNNGTLIIKNIENMSSNTQEGFLKFLETGNFRRLGGSEYINANVRIIVTTTDIGLMQERLNQRLFRILSAHKLEIPPLRDRKKDIPALMEHFVDKISKTRHIQAKKFSKAATNKLLKYEYPGNVKELENVIERAITLSKGDADIEEEEIFLGDTTKIEDEKRINLLNIPLIRKLCESPGIILAIKITILISFVSILYLLAAQSDISIGGRNIALILCWQLSLPLLFVVFLFAGRFGCGICPISSISKFFNKHINLKISIPSFVKNNDGWFMGVGFISILFMEKYSHMAYSIDKTAYLIFSILLAAIIIDFVFEKSAWCRHLCPLGGLGGIFSMSSMIEIRSNRNTCTTICTTHDCYKGSERAAPCPMFLHLQFLSDNRNCKVCLNCIKSCTHNATRLNLRIPGAEISSLRQPTLAGAFFSIILSGLLLAEILFQSSVSQASFPLVFSASICFALILNLLSNFSTALTSKETIIEHIKHFGYTLLPLTLFGFMANRAIDVFGNVEGSLMIFNIYKLNVNFTTAFQLLIIFTGLLITEYLIYKLIQNKITKDKQSLVFVIQGIVPLIFSVIYIMLFFI
ncbi:MAG: sigma 54-interacting transcriptional regulator [Candidatus Scalindua sp.]